MKCFKLEKSITFQLEGHILPSYSPSRSRIMMIYHEIYLGRGEKGHVCNFILNQFVPFKTQTHQKKPHLVSMETFGFIVEEIDDFPKIKA